MKCPVYSGTSSSIVGTLHGDLSCLERFKGKYVLNTEVFLLTCTCRSVL